MGKNTIIKATILNPDTPRCYINLFCLKANSPTDDHLAQLQITNKTGSLFRSLTEVEVSEFYSIYTSTQIKYVEHEQKRLARENRKRKVGADHPFKLQLQEKLLMFLIYYRLYITSTLAGVLFELDQSNDPQRHTKT